jgi:hypothetical protein
MRRTWTKMNRAADAINAELEEVLEYQALDQFWEEDYEHENNLQLSLSFYLPLI